jgi:hypothetical protein
MGKRSQFDRVARDNYETPASAAAPLMPHLSPRTRFIEPCCGSRKLVEQLESFGHICVGGYDLPTDARTACYRAELGVTAVTNPPFC